MLPRKLLELRNPILHNKDAIINYFEVDGVIELYCVYIASTHAESVLCGFAY